MALDYGTVRVGVALSDELQTLARPLPFIPAEPNKKLIEAIAEIVKSQGVELILVGMPRNMDGSYGESANRAKTLVKQLQESLTIPIKTVDERLSTVQASRQLRETGKNAKAQKTLIDSAAASVLLQAYLDASGGSLHFS